MSESFTGGTVASFHTASQANSRSNPVTFFRKASPMSESAWVPTCTYRSSNYSRGAHKCYYEGDAYHNTRFNNILPHWQPTSLGSIVSLPFLRRTRSGTHFLEVIQHASNHPRYPLRSKQDGPSPRCSICVLNDSL